MKFKEAIAKAKAAENKRNFRQTVEMVVNLKEVDAGKLTFNDAFRLPKGPGKPRFITVVAGGEVGLKAKPVASLLIEKKDLGQYTDKKKAKQLANQTDFFVVELPLMGEFAKVMGTVLGPRGKMPLPKHIVPFNADPVPLIETLKQTVRMVVKKAPVVHLMIGTEEMSDEDLTENADFLYENLIHKLEKEAQNVKNVYIKLTMGKPVKVE
ncbi:MAG TPA: 50S ribosomal protein L1 [archaeon]|nr:50S ribosomal protein L1 [archaeon]